jgi:hypothetical protein
MDIQNTRRILLVGAPNAPILDLLQGLVPLPRHPTFYPLPTQISALVPSLTPPSDLTGTKPTPPPNETSLAGLSHALPLKTAYYTASIPIWIDVPAIPLPATDSTATSSSATTASYSTWATSFLDTSIPGASDVLTALGAFIICFRKPSSGAEFEDIKALLTAVARVVEGCKELSSKEGNGEWDGVCLAVGLRRAVVPGLEVLEEEWEDICMERGFEFVDGEVEGRGRNEFGGMCCVDLFYSFCCFIPWSISPVVCSVGIRCSVTKFLPLA